MGRMDEVQSMWDRVSAQAESAGSGDKREYVPVPDGEHVVVLKSVELQQNEGKDPSLVPTFYFPSQNVTEKTWLNITPVEGAMKALHGFFSRLKLTPRTADPDELLRVAKQAEGWTIKVAKKTEQKGKYTNRKYYINGIVSKATATGQSTVTTSASADSVPF